MLLEIAKDFFGYSDGQVGLTCAWNKPLTKQARYLLRQNDKQDRLNRYQTSKHVSNSTLAKQLNPNKKQALTK